MAKKDLTEVVRKGIDYVIASLHQLQSGIQVMPPTNSAHGLTVKLPRGRVVRIEVKTTDDGQAKPKWLIHRQYRQVTDADLYFVFVAFDGDELRAAYVLPSVMVAKHLDEVNTAYDERNPTAKAARPYKVIAHDSFLPQYNMGWLEPYNDNWDMIFGHAA